MGKRVAAIALIMLAFGLAACRSSTLPPPLTEEQLRAIATTRFKASVGVDMDRFPVHSTSLMVALLRTDLFDRVDALDKFETPPTFVARVAHPLYPIYDDDEGAVGLLLWAVSLGIFPARLEVEHGHDFTLTPSSTGSGKAQEIAIEFSYRSQTTLGWWAFFDGGSADKTLEDIEEHTRFIQGLAWQIVRHAKAISRDVDGGT